MLVDILAWGAGCASLLCVSIALLKPTWILGREIAQIDPQTGEIIETPISTI